MDDEGFSTTPPDLAQPPGEARFAALFHHAAVGRCVNAVTHDINNQLGAAMAYAELAALDAALAPETRRMLGEIVSATARCAALVTHLTDIARPVRPRADSADPGDLLRRAIGLRQYDLRRHGIAVELDAAPESPMLLVDAPQVQMALLHLLFNAEEALAAFDGPRVLRATARPLPGGGAALGLWNSAPPVPEAWRARIAEPFATSRGGAHFGYGLTAARAVAARHGGGLDYDPATGFTLRLVRVAAPAAD